MKHIGCYNFQLKTKVHLRTISAGRKVFSFAQAHLLKFVFLVLEFFFFSKPRREIFVGIISQWNCWMQPIKKQKTLSKIAVKIKMSSSNQLTSYVFSNGIFSIIISLIKNKRYLYILIKWKITIKHNTIKLQYPELLEVSQGKTLTN